MIMSDSEISASYREAKDRKGQIQVLADLNACPREEMEQYLCKLGLIHDTPQPAFDYLRAAELYADGLCDLDIAEQMGVGVYKIANWRRSKGFRPNRKPMQTATAPAKKRKKPVPKAAPPSPLPTATPTETGLSVRGLWEILGRIAETYPNAALYLGGAPLCSVGVQASFGPGGAMDVSVTLSGKPMESVQFGHGKEST